jgi:hypothetical protein
MRRAHGSPLSPYSTTIACRSFIRAASAARLSRLRFSFLFTWDSGNDSCSIHTEHLPPSPAVSICWGCLLNPEFLGRCNRLRIKPEIRTLGAFTYLCFCQRPQGRLHCCQAY